MQRIAIDMDEVTADTMAHYLNLYNAEFDRNLTKEHFRGKRIFDVIDRAHVARSREYFHTADFFTGIPVMEGSQEVIRELMSHYEVFITTAAMDVPCSFSSKFEWLQKHFPFIPASNVVFCGDKSIIAADYLIDDDPRHFRRFRGEGILFTAPHNVNETAFRRVDNWSDLGHMFALAVNHESTASSKR
ncbi:MAG: 5'-3'-deoxyribonucleotidase [Acidobacteriota bacterium]|nr:5'-3'-deoxyribonucleotidase [Acidobacteriota bacterium]